MRIRSLFVALCGVGIAGGSVFLAQDLLNSKANASPEGPAVVEVIVANQDIAFGKAIEPHMLTTIAWPKAALPPGVFTEFEKISGSDDIKPRRAKTALSQGELILVGKVSDFGEKVTIVQTLGSNLRAMAIKVDVETAVGGFVTPGDRVDVVLTQGRNETLRAVTILQNIRVIGVDQEADEETDAPKTAGTVTVEVTPEQGQRLALAQEAGTLNLSLRTLDNVEDKPLDSIKLSDILKEKSPVPEEEKRTVVMIRRGVETTEVEF